MGFGQENSASANKYFTSRRVIHEMMHAIGFFHEDSRPDRDEHVDTDREIMRVNTVSMVGEYDVCSIMHHNSDKLVPKKCKVWTCADCPDCYNCDVGDVRRNVTELDVQKINLYYDCNKIGIHFTGCCPAICKSKLAIYRLFLGLFLVFLGSFNM